MLRSLTRPVPSIARCTHISSIYRPKVSFFCAYSTVMATPVASSSQPVQIPALKGPHAGDAKKPKEKKDKVAAAASQYSLEVSNLTLSFNV